MRILMLAIAAALITSIPMTAPLKAEETTIIKKDRDLDRDKKVIIKKEEPRENKVIIKKEHED